MAVPSGNCFTEPMRTRSVKSSRDQVRLELRHMRKMEQWTKLLFCAFMASCVLSVQSANILFFVGITNYSHRMAMWPLVEKLAERGHSVTFVSAHPPGDLANSKVTEFIPKSVAEMMKRFQNSDLLGMRLAGEDEGVVWTNVMELSVMAYEALAEDQEFLQWYQTAKFDLVFIDALYSEFALGIAFKSKAQFAIISTTHPYMWQLDDYGAPVESSWMPDMQLRYFEEEDMSLVQRIFNTLHSLRWHFRRYNSFLPRIDAILREKMGLNDMPDLAEYHKNVSLVLTNSHYAEEYGRSQPPMIVPVGGMHCFKNTAEVPRDLEAFMNKSGRDGFIYVSFGSAAKLSRLPPDVRQTFFTAMRNSRTNFLLKWDGDIPEDMPKNTFTAAWLPQQRVLAHANIRGFITHGGLLGIQEAMCNGVPLIVMPIFGEQDYNANRIHRRGRGIRLDLYGITPEKITNAVSTILTDPSYKKNMMEAKELFLDRPQSAVDTAVWWTEYILKRGRVDYMKPLGIRQTWYQRRLLDVWFTLFVVLFVIPLGLIILVIRCFTRPSKPQAKKQKRN